MSAARDPGPVPSALIAARPALAMHARDGLCFDGVPLGPLAARGTPAWVHSADTLRRRLRRWRQAMPDVAVHYAVKANGCPALLAALARDGAGADVVSGGELALALEAGFEPATILFSGVGKTAAELRAALEAGIGQINVESAEELHLLSAIALEVGRVAPVALRVNPDVAADTHDKIATGREGDKFGVAHHAVPGLYARGAALPGIRMRGLAVHIGSQVGDLAPFRAAWRRLAGLVAAIRAAGHTVEVLDAGGGLGIAYGAEPTMLPEAWAGALRETLGPCGVKLAVEPGRWLAGPAGLLLASVVRVRREAMARPMLVLDAAMNDLLRPALYGAWHGIVPLDPIALHRPCAPCDVVGPVCESADVFARRRPLPPLEEGSTVAILDAGAYGAVMSSSYNARRPAARWLIDGGLAGPAP